MSLFELYLRVSNQGPVESIKVRICILHMRRFLAFYGTVLRRPGNTRILLIGSRIDAFTFDDALCSRRLNISRVNASTKKV